MALDSYTNLYTSVINISHRNDITPSLFQDFVTLMEAELNNSLVCKELENTSTTATTTSRFYALPTGLRQIRSFHLFSSGSTRELVMKSPDNLNVSATSGFPTQFTIVGTNIEFNKAPDAAYDVRLAYVKTVTALTAAAPTNSLLTAYPLMYYYGILSKLFEWTEEEEKAVYYQTKFGNVIENINKQNAKERKGSGAAMRTTSRYLP